MNGPDDLSRDGDDLDAPLAGPEGWFEDTLRAAADLGLDFNRPQPPESHVASVNGIRLRYLDWGNGHLPGLLFIHGFAQQAHSWDFAALAVQDLFHVISIDLRGHGESEWSPDGMYSFDDLYADVDAFVAAADLKQPVICGLSLGGTLAYTYVSRNPTGVKALVIAESVPESRKEGMASIRAFTSGPGTFATLEDLVDKVRTLTPWRSAEQVRSSLVHSVGRNEADKWTWKYDPAIRTLHERPVDSDSRWSALGRVNVPTLLIRGEDSDITDAATFERMKSVVPGSQIVSIPGAGHRVSGDNPARFNAALRSFVADHAARTEGR